MEDTLDFKLTVDEANTILGALGNLPYVQVVNIITKLQAQAQEQFAAKEKKVEDSLFRAEHGIFD
jgi:hypothetical protein